MSGLLAVLAFLLFGASLRDFVTFGDAINPVEGLVAWWTLMLVPALAYAAYAMPWASRE